MSDNGWPKWFADSIKQYPSPEAYYLACTSYERPLVSALRSVCPPPASLIEVGCGIGISAALFASEGYTVTAIDNDTQMLQIATEMPWIASSGGRLQFECRDAYKLPTSYDIATSLGVIEHETKPNRAAMLQEMVRCARFALVSIPTSWINDYGNMGEHNISLRQLVNECKCAGWRVLSSFGWGNPKRFQNLVGYIPPVLWYRIQSLGYLSNSLCVIGRKATDVDYGLPHNTSGRVPR